MGSQDDAGISEEAEPDVPTKDSKVFVELQSSFRLKHIYVFPLTPTPHTAGTPPRRLEDVVHKSTFKTFAG